MMRASFAFVLVLTSAAIAAVAAASNATQTSTSRSGTTGSSSRGSANAKLFARLRDGAAVPLEEAVPELKKIAENLRGFAQRAGGLQASMPGNLPFGFADRLAEINNLGTRTANLWRTSDGSSDDGSGSDDNAEDDMLGLDQVALAITSAAFNLAASIVYTVSGGLATAGAKLALQVATIATVTGPISFYLAADNFIRTEINNINNRIANGDKLQDLINAIKRWNEIRDKINNGTLVSEVAEHINKVRLAKTVLLAAARKWKSS
mmetsp:Transcript_40631/g.90336  ORF Transcript_40631/g.90336 Transcript_40631/m.90336 type:complete len:264 (+) Transcript_40631:178-969(+)